MSGSGLLGTVCAGVALGTLVWAGIAHVRRVRTLEWALRRQRLLPTRLLGAVARVVGVSEIVIGAGGLAAILTGSPGWRLLFLVAATLLYASYAIYVAALVRLRPNVPCGCGPRGDVATNWTVARNVLYLVAVATALGFQDEIAAFGGSYLGVLDSTLAAVGLAVLIWVTPAAAYLSSLADLNVGRTEQ